MEAPRLVEKSDTPRYLKLNREFRIFEGASLQLCLHRVLSAQAPELATRLQSLRNSRLPGAGNRGSGFPIRISGAPEMFARRSQRGGLMRLFSSDLYLGAKPRPLQELKISLEASRRGIPVAEALGAMVEWVGPLLYRGYFLSRALAGMTLWDFMRTDDDPMVRTHVLDQARELLETAHARGLYHADLNLHNLFVTRFGESFSVVLLDLDKARLYRGSLPNYLRRSNFKRLRRSASKLDPVGRYLDPYALSRLGLG